MGDSSFTRMVNFLTLGPAAELFGQKKPFQGLGSNSRPKSGSFATFVNDPGHGAVKAIGRAVMPKRPTLPQLPAAPTNQAAREAVNSAVRRGRSRGFRSTVLNTGLLDASSALRQTTIGS